MLDSRHVLNEHLSRGRSPIAGLINRLKEPWAELLVNVKSGINDVAGDIIFGSVVHGDMYRR